MGSKVCTRNADSWRHGVKFSFATRSYRVGPQFLCIVFLLLWWDNANGTNSMHLTRPNVSSGFCENVPDVILCAAVQGV